MISNEALNLETGDCTFIHGYHSILVWQWCMNMIEYSYELRKNYILSLNNVFILKTVPPATCVLWDRFIVLRVYTKGTVFMTPAVCNTVMYNTLALVTHLPRHPRTHLVDPPPRPRWETVI